MRMELYNKFMKLLHIGQYLNNFQKDIIYQNRKDRLTELALCSSTKGISKERYLLSKGGNSIIDNLWKKTL